MRPGTSARFCRVGVLGHSPDQSQWRAARRVCRGTLSRRDAAGITETPPEGPNTRPGRRPDDKRWGNGGALPAYMHQGLSEAVSAAVHPPCKP